MSDRKTQPIPDDKFWNRMREGHKKRHGHKLSGILVSTDNGQMYVLERTCCGDGNFDGKEN